MVLNNFDEGDNLICLVDKKTLSLDQPCLHARS